MIKNSRDIATNAAPHTRHTSQISAQITSDISHPLHERRLAVRESDWNRLKRNISSIKTAPLSLSVISSILFGFAGSTLITMIPLFFTTGLPPWVIPAYGAAAVATLIPAVAMVVVEKFYLKTKARDSDEVLTDMNEIAAELCAPRENPTEL